MNMQKMRPKKFVDINAMAGKKEITAGTSTEGEVINEAKQKLE